MSHQHFILNNVSLEFLKIGGTIQKAVKSLLALPTAETQTSRVLC